MLTSRGWWFLFFVLILLALAVLGQFTVQVLFPRNGPVLPETSLGLFALTLGLWFCWEYLLFSVRSQVLVRRLRVHREIRDAEGPVQTLWAGRTYEISVHIRVPTPVDFPYALLTDHPPFGSIPVSGDNKYEGNLKAGQVVSLTYHIRCAAAGSLRFGGLTVAMADLQGFFFHSTFIRAVARYRVLPRLTEIEGRAPTFKRHNFLVPPGVHRYRRPGSGTELLDLRDYLPGDPPKTIAWKASARRDRLITKEFESEVPVRCTLFLDTSDSVRVGPGGESALGRLVEISAAVAQSAISAHDLVGLCCFDESRTSYVRPARTGNHLIRLLNQLAEASSLMPETGMAPLETVLPLAYGYALEAYPDLMRSDINRVPFWLAWLTPPPAYTLPKPSWSDYFYRWMPFLLPVYWVLGLWLIALGLVATGIVLAAYASDPLLYLLLYGLAALTASMGFSRLPKVLLFPQHRRFLEWRKQLSALLSIRYGLAPGGLELLLEDNERFTHYLQRFLGEEQIPFPVSLFDDNGRYVFKSPAKIEILSKALLRAVGKGHDNELFVLLVDLLELDDAIDPLLRAVKVALARHHRVAIICPWLPGVPPPLENPTAVIPTGFASLSTDIFGKNFSIESALAQTMTDRLHRAFYRLRRTFGRLAVPVACAGTGMPERFILERLNLLRGTGRSR